MFSIVNFAYLALKHHHLHMEVLSPLIRYAKACSTYTQFLKRGKLLAITFIKQYYQQAQVKLFRKFHGWYNDLVSKYNFPLGRMLTDVFLILDVSSFFLITELSIFPFFRTHQRDKEYMTDVTNQQRMFTHPWHLNFLSRSMFTLLLFCILWYGFWFLTLFVITTCHLFCPITWFNIFFSIKDIDCFYYLIMESLL